MQSSSFLRFPVAVLAAFALTFTTGCHDGPTEPNGPYAEALAPLANSDIPFLSYVYTGELPQTHSTSPFGMSSMLASADGSITFDVIGNAPNWAASLGYQASQTSESGDYIRPTRPGVLSQVEVGLSSWACESGGWHTDDCQSASGATFSHPITLNLHAVDYTGSAPAAGALIGTVTQTFDIPYRPSADDTECTDGRFLDERLGICARGYNTTVVFDMSGSDIVVPSEFIYGVQFNTQTYGPNPIGSNGPFNSLNFGLVPATDVAVGEDARVADLFWNGTLYQFDPVDWPYTGAVAFTVTNEGHVTGGGWFNSPEGALYGTADYTWFQGFENGLEGWQFGGDYGAITQVASGTDGISSSGGDFHALAEGTSSGPYTFFGGAHDYFPAGGWTAEVDVHLDPAWEASTGFDYSVASYTSAGGHLQDFIFHVTKDASTGNLLVAGSNNTNFAVREDLETINHYAVMTAGWYTLQHAFRNDNGILAVDLNLLDANGNVLFTETHSDASNTIPDVVGGNGYGWFTFISVVGGIAIDNTMLTGFGSALVGTDATGRASFGFSARYKKGANVPSGNTNFIFQDGGLHFNSSSYDWLVVNQNDSNAQFKGVGTIAAMAGDYGFMLWAGDHDTGDTFRIKIWEVADESNVVYDNGTDQLIEGGNIVVHTGKK